MDLHANEMGLDEFWTNEKHVSFLNWIEASFVESLIESRDRCSLTYAVERNLPLDRQLPDCEDSTVNLKSTRGMTRKTMNSAGQPHIYNSGRTQRPVRSNTSEPYDDSSHDQVVPHITAITPNGSPLHVDTVFRLGLLGQTDAV